MEGAGGCTRVGAAREERVSVLDTWHNNKNISFKNFDF